MSAKAPSASDSILADSDRLLASATRVYRYYAAEGSGDVDNVMSTVTPLEQLRSAKTLAWSLSLPGPDGKPRLTCRTSHEDVRAFYENLLSDDLPVTDGLPASYTTHAGSWYWFMEGGGTRMADAATGQVTRTIYPIQIFTVDGDEGIASEIAWLRSTEVDLDVSVRYGQWWAYLAALRGNDLAALTGLFAPWVQSSQRDYSLDDAPFVGIDGRDQLGDHFARLFGRYEIVGVEVVTMLVRDWLVFHDLLVTVRSRRGGAAGRESAFRLAEYAVFDAAGSFEGLCGFGTLPEPVTPRN